MAYAIENSIDPRWQVAFEFDVMPGETWPLKWDYRGEARSIAPDAVPKRAVFDTDRIGLPDFVIVEAWKAVSQRVRDHIEAIEPRRHEFFAFEPARRKSKKPLMGPDGAALITPYYMLNVMTRIDAVLIERSPIRPIHPVANLVSPIIGRIGEVVLDKTLVAGHHVWEGNKHMRGQLFFSDALGDWIIANKLKPLRMTHLREQ